MQVVNVDLGERSYEIIIGKDLLVSCAEFFARQDYSKKVLVITDQEVDKLYAAAFIKTLEMADFTVAKFVTVCGEDAKNLSWAEKIYTEAIKMQFDRKSPFVALGGGVVGDLAGFVAATYMRGVPFIQIPTTLLAQVDSSVGGKVAVNHPAGKNMIGTFYQPNAVFADIDTLTTLSDRDYASGLAEVVKYACLIGEDFLFFLENNVAKIKEKDADILFKIISRCCGYKANIVAGDEKDSGKRMYLNLGHTYGHAIETIGGFSQYSHGEAIAIGLHGALLLSEIVHALDKSVTRRVSNLLQEFSLPIFANEIDAKTTFISLWHDKKAIGGSLHWILLQSLGDVKIKKDVDTELVKKTMEKIIV